MEAPHIHYSVQETECCKVPRDLWVIAQQELTLDYGGSEGTFSFSVPQCPPPPPPPVHLHRQTATTKRTQDCITAVLWSDGWWWVYCVAADRMKDCLGALLCQWSAWPRTTMTGEERLFPRLYCPPGTLVRFMRKAEQRMRREEGEVVWPADNTWQETDRLDMGTCPHLCSRKGIPGPALLHTEPVNTDTPPSDRIPAMRLSVFHFLCLDLGGPAPTPL